MMRRLLSFILAILSLPAWSRETAEPATIDLASWKDGQHLLTLTEPWEFHWETWLEPGMSHSPPTEFKKIGISWNEQVRADGSYRPAIGFATYKLTLKNIPPRAQGYQIGIKGAGTAYRLILYPKNRPELFQVIEQGRIDPEHFQSSRKAGFLSFHPLEKSDYILLLQVRNKEYAWGGAYFPILLATDQQVRKNFEAEGLVSAIAVGIMLAVGIYSFMVWFRRRQDRAALMLSLVAGASILRLLATSPFLVDILPDQLFNVLIRTEFISMNLGIFSYLAFLIASFRDGRKSLWDRSLSAANLLIISIYVLSPVGWFPYLLPLTQLLIVASAATFVVYSITATKRKQSGGRLVLASCLIIALAVSFDIVMARVLLSEIFVTPWAIMVFLILQSQLVALRAAEAYRRSQLLTEELTVKNKEITFFSRNLERLVDTKTKEIRSLLDHIPQGVFSVGSEGRIAKDFSAHLIDILEIQDLAGQTFEQGILSRCQLNPDERDQVLQTIAVCLGESQMNFLINVDKLPPELVYQIEGKTKILKVTWNTQVNDQDQVEKILVTFLDITAEKILEHESLEQRRTLEKIKELVDQQPQRINQFFSTVVPLLEENARIIAQSKLEVGDVRLLFVNAHTVKGAARTLHFRSLADVIHQAEDQYALILKGAVPDRLKLEADCKRMRAELESYREINRVKLNRSDDLSKIMIDRELILSHYNTVSSFLEQDKLTIEQLMNFLKEHSEKLTRLIFEQLETVFDSYRERAIKIAKDLGKAEPHLEIDLPSVTVSAEIRIAIDNCMIHILRNALDHGIETPEERQRAQKSPGGTIWIRGLIQDQFLHLTIEDDGRGLALDRLKERGIKNGRLQEASTAEAIAALVFDPGVSTANTVTDISGRGVGMGAVRTFLKEIEGDIHIVLKEAHPSLPGYRAFAFVLRIPLDHQRIRQAA